IALGDSQRSELFPHGAGAANAHARENGGATFRGALEAIGQYRFVEKALVGGSVARSAADRPRQLAGEVRAGDDTRRAPEQRRFPRRADRGTRRAPKAARPAT